MISRTLLLLVICIAITLSACRKDTATVNTPTISSPEETKIDPMAETIETSNESFLSMVEADYCIEYLEDVVKCYKSHSTAIKSDFLGSLPISLNKPYDAPINWEKYKTASDFNVLWSYKCGFLDEKSGTKLNYYCPNISGHGGQWLDSLSKHNEFIDHFNNSYRKTQSFDPNLQRSVILEADTALDFNDKDHRTFYWWYHMGLAELKTADKKFAAMIK
jgi:hypothetical protein